MMLQDAPRPIPNPDDLRTKVARLGVRLALGQGRGRLVADLKAPATELIECLLACPPFRLEVQGVVVEAGPLAVVGEAALATTLQAAVMAQQGRGWASIGQVRLRVEREVSYTLLAVVAEGAHADDYAEALLAVVAERWPELLDGVGLPASTPADRELTDESKAKPRGMRLPDYERRRAIWEAIELRWNQTKSYAKCRSLLREKRPELLNPGKRGPTISDKTLKAIIQQGQRGELRALP